MSMTLRSIYMDYNGIRIIVYKGTSAFILLVGLLN